MAVPLKPGYVEAILPAAAAARVLAIGASIPDADLTHTGRELHPHITCRWGLWPDSPAEVSAALARTPPFVVYLEEVTAFAVPLHGLVHVKVGRATPLYEIHRRLGREVKHVDSAWEYTPHVTVAFTRPLAYPEGPLPQFQAINLPVLIQELVLVMPDKSRHPIPLTRGGRS